MSIIHLKNQFDSIGAVSGRLEKEALIKKFGEDKLFLDTLDFVFNPYVVTGLAKKKIERDVPQYLPPATELGDMFKFIKENNSGSDLIIGKVKAFISLQEPETHQFLKDVFTKDVQIGVSHKTINKALGKELIPEYSVQLAKKYEDEEAKITGRFSISLKLDGIRCTVFNDGEVPKFFSRKGLPIEGMTQLEEEFKRLPKGLVYDGELVAENPNNLHSKDLFRVTQQIVRKDGEKTGLQFIAFDCLPLGDFYKGRSSYKYSYRIANLEDIISKAETKYVQVVPIYYVGDDKDHIPEIMKHVTSEGYEGLMLNTLDGIYETKRSSNLLKIKQFQSADLRIVGFEEHRKKPGTLGSIVVDYKGFIVNVGSGFTDADRLTLWQKRADILGKIAEVQYFEESSNQSGSVSLRFPVFLQIREDKDEVSYH